jgi:hypothetical protein
MFTPAVSTESGGYYSTIALTSGTTYTYSITVQGEAGKLYYIWFSTNAGALIGAKKAFRATGHKQRVFVTYTETSSASRQFHITRDAQYTDQNVFYADGLQVEAKDHPTTFTDGSLTGFVIGETPYLWTGTPGASTSTRSAQTRSGGREVKLLDYGIRILSIIGLGMMPLIDQSLPIPGFGELAQGTGTKAREFVLVGEIGAEAGSRQMSAILSTIYDAVKPDLVVKDQPLILRYQQQDEDGDPCGESLDILCKYRTGLEGQNDNNHSRRVGITFKQYIPYLKSTYDNGAALGFQSNVANANYILKRGTDGIWAAMQSGTNGIIRVIAQAPDGSIWIGGDFTNLTDANGDYLSRWNGTAFVSVGTGVTGPVYTIAFAPNGDAYIGGNFINQGDANGSCITKWDGVAYSSLGTGMNGTVYSLVYGTDGNLYAGGGFTLAGGVAGTAYVAKWNGAAWVAMSGGTSGPLVTSLAWDKNSNSLYVGGSFLLAGGVSDTQNIAKWSPNSSGTYVWTPLYLGLDGIPQIILIAPSGIVYVGGDFDYAITIDFPLIPLSKIGSWNGTKWSPLSTGIDASGIVYDMSINPIDGNIYIGGAFTSAGGVTPPDSIVVWNGSVFVPIDINTPNVSSIYSVFFDKNGNLYIGFSESGTAVSATVLSPNVGSSIAYPIVTYTGPGTLYQLKNYITNRSIFFNLTLLAGETAVLNLDPFHSSFVSSFRGDIWGSAILKGSNLNWFLQPGANNISSFIYGSTTAATAITIRWQDQYNSLDAAVWK